MKTLTRLDLERSVRETIRPLYLLLGTESYLRGATADAITNAALSETLLREFNVSSFSLLTDAVQSAVAAAEQLPMMSNRRVVRIKDFAKLRDADEQVLIAYLKNPAPSILAALTSSSGTVT